MITPPSAASDHQKLMGALLAERERYLAFIHRRVSSRASAEDILQSGLAKAFERASTLKEPGALEGWFFQILRNAIVDHLRREAAQGRTRNHLAEESPESIGPLERTASSCQCVKGLKESLKPEYAEILQRVEIDGTPVKAFAAERGITASAAGVRVHRARNALREKVQGTCGACAAEGCQDCTCGRSAPPGFRE